MAFIVRADGNLLYSSINSFGNTILSPKLKTEINKAGSFTFTILPNHPLYDALNRMTTVVTVKQDDVLLFRGRVIDCKTDFYKQKNVTCEGDLAFLLDSVISPFEYTGTNSKTIRYVFKHIVDEHNSQVDNWKQFSYDNDFITVTKDENSSVTDRDEFNHTSYGDASSVLTSELIDAYGGVLKTRTVNDVTYLDYVKDPSQDSSQYSLNSQKIQFSVNLLDIEQSYPVNDIFTVLMPIGRDKTTIESVNNGSKFLENATAIAEFGRIVKVEQWNDEKDPAKLKEKAQKYLNQHSKIFANDLTVKAIDLHALDSSVSQIKLCDRVKCISAPHGINTTLVCLSIEYDLQNPENNSYKIGNFIPSDKHKGKVSKTSTGRRRGGTGSSKASLSLKNADVSQIVDQVQETENTDFWTNIKNAGRTVVGKLKEDASATIHDVFGIDDIVDENGNLSLPSYEDLTTGATETVKPLLDITKDVYRIDADIVEINGRKILIGTEDTESVSIEAQYIDITGLIKNLLVNHLDATSIDTITFRTPGTIRVGGINALPASGFASATKVYVPTLGLSIQSSDIYHAVNVETLLDILNGDSTKQNFNSSPYVTQSNLITNRLSANFGSLNVRDSHNTDHTVATQDWVNDLLTSGTVSGVFRTLNLRDDNQNWAVATQNWVNVKLTTGVTDGVFKTLKIKKMEGGQERLYLTATQDWVTDQNYATQDWIANTLNYNLTNSEFNSVKSKGALQVYRNAGVASGYQSFLPNFLSLSQSMNKAYILSTSNIDISHSHSVTVDDTTGVVTLGGAVATDASGRSFNIADTKKYRDDVSAAFNSVTVDVLRMENNGLDYDETRNRYTVSMYAKASNDNDRSADIQFYATDAKQAGIDSVTVDVLRMQDSGLSYDSTWNRYTVSMYAKASNDNDRSANIQFYATDAKQAGIDSVTVDSITKGTVTFDQLTGMLKIPVTATASNSATNSVDLSAAIPEDAVTVSSFQNTSSVYTDTTQMYSLGFRIELSTGHSEDKSISFTGEDARSAGYTEGDRDGYTRGTLSGIATGKTQVLNYFTTHDLKDVYVYKEGNSYYADVTFNYDNTDYIRGHNPARVRI